MKQLALTDPDGYKKLIVAYREKVGRSGKGRPQVRFDFTQYKETVTESRRQEDLVKYRPMIFASYLKHHQEQPEPFKMTAAEAAAQWARDLKCPDVRSEKKRFFNKRTGQHELLDVVYVAVWVLAASRWNDCCWPASHDGKACFA